MAASKSSHSHSKLGQLAATAISGNDILSSSLYVSGIAVLYAGIYAPLVLGVIALVLFFYKAVYTEVVEALPINGGAYNCLLNGTSKTVAATAGVTTVLSYVATAVISATTAIQYVNSVIPIPVIPCTLGLLAFFAVLVAFGIKDSAKVAMGIFIFHILVLTSFIVMGAIFFLHGHSDIVANWHYTQDTLLKTRSLPRAFAFGFAASLLGVSGFESSANFVEEQQPGVFRKTLRNMLLGVAIFNPLLAFVALNTSSITSIVGAKDFVLSNGALAMGGALFQYLIVADAFLVLSGAVLTAYVGVTGLMYRMAADACLPEALIKTSKFGSQPRVIATFFLLCVSILLLTNGNLLSLAGVYTIAFLGVMSLFAIGNLILREARSDLRRTYKAPVLFVLLAFCATAFGIVGNIEIDPRNLEYFLAYFVPFLGVVLAMIFEDKVNEFLKRASGPVGPIYRALEKRAGSLREGTYVAFVHNPKRLHMLLDYINRNEAGHNVILAYCAGDGAKEGKAWQERAADTVATLKRLGVFPHLNVTPMYVEEDFGPEVIDHLSKKLRVRKNRMFIGSLHDHHQFDYSELGGVRIIFD